MITEEQLTEWQRLHEKARREVCDLASGKKQFGMTVPPRPEDTDILLCGAIDALPVLIAEVRRLREGLGWQSADINHAVTADEVARLKRYCVGANDEDTNALQGIIQRWCDETLSLYNRLEAARNDFGKLDREVANLIETTEWQPVETAVKDKGYILGLSVNGRHWAVRWVKIGDSPGMWLNYDGKTIEITHWMPCPALPQPPEVTTGQQREVE